MGYELEYTSQIKFDGETNNCFAFGEVFGHCTALNLVFDQLFRGICTLLNSSLDDFTNVGGGDEWYITGSNSPKNIRSFLSDPGISLTQGVDEITMVPALISSNGSVIITPVGGALDIKASGGGNFQNVGTGTGEIYYQFVAGVFQMRRLNYGQSLISEVDDKGFISISTLTDEVRIQERKGGYATVTTSINTGVTVGVWIPSLSSSPFGVSGPYVYNTYDLKYCLTDNMMIINYDFDLEFTLAYTPPVDGNLVISASLSDLYNTIYSSMEAVSGFSEQAGSLEFKQVTQGVVFYDMGVAPSEDDVDVITNRYDNKNFCEAKLTSSVSDIGTDYQWPQESGAFDQLLFSMIPVLHANKGSVHRFVSRGTLVYAIHPRKTFSNYTIADYYDENANIEKNF